MGSSRWTALGSAAAAAAAARTGAARQQAPASAAASSARSGRPSSRAAPSARRAIDVSSCRSHSSMMRWTADPSASARARPGGAPGPPARTWSSTCSRPLGLVARAGRAARVSSSDRAAIQASRAATMVAASRGGSSGNSRDRRLGRREHEHSAGVVLLGDDGRRRKGAGDGRQKCARRAAGDGPEHGARGDLVRRRRQPAEVRHYEPIAGPRGGDVEQPPQLAFAHDLLALVELQVPLRLEIARDRPGQLGLELDGKATVVAVDDRLAACPASARSRPTDEHDDGELEALGLVDGEQMDHVRVIVDLRLLLAGGVAGLGGPRQEGAEAAAAGVREGSRALDELLEIGDRLGRPGAGGGQELRSAGETRQLGEQLVGFAVGATRMQVAQDAEGGGDRVVTRRLLRSEQVEASTRGPEQEQVVVAEAEQRRVQGAVDGRTVAGVVHRPQAEQGVVDLATLEIGLAALYPVRHPGLAQRLFVGLQAGGRTEQQGDVAPAERAQTFGVAGRVAVTSLRTLRRIAVLDLPVLGVVAVHAGEQPGHRARLVATGGVGLAGFAAVGPPEQDGDSSPAGRRAQRLRRACSQAGGLPPGRPQTHGRRQG